MDATLGRAGKLSDIAREPIVMCHLRVCFEHRTEDQNCSRCEKCLRTMALLEGLGCLADYENFDHSISVARSLDQLARLPANLREIWEDMTRHQMAPETVAAVRRAIDRSRPKNRFLKRAWKSIGARLGVVPPVR